jgi:hypothetical protein
MVRLSLGTVMRLTEIASYYGLYKSEMLALLRVEFLNENPVLCTEDGRLNEAFLFAQKDLFVNGGKCPLFVGNLKGALRAGMDTPRRDVSVQCVPGSNIVPFPTFLGVSPRTARPA